MLITLGGLIMAAAAAFMLAVSGPVARSLGNAIAVAVLYYATPTVKQPRFRWISAGAALLFGAELDADLERGRELPREARALRRRHVHAR